MMRLIFFFIFIVLIRFFFNFFSFLNSLLILESASLLLFFFSMFLIVNLFSLKFLLYYFVFIVSERAMGLSILVMCIKMRGLRNFRSLSLTAF